MSGAFATPVIPALPRFGLALQCGRTAVPLCTRATTTRRRQRGPRCATTKLLVVDLQELLRQTGQADMSYMAELSQRIEVDRSNAQDQTFVLFSSVSGYDASMRSIHDAGLVDPDALTTLSGTELYQRQYRTPDPFWRESVRGGWTPRPVEWAMTQFFAEEVDAVDCEDAFVVKVGCKGDGPSADFCSRVWTKLKEMGISARVIVGEELGQVLIVPAAGSAADVIAFCQMMLGVSEDCSFVFGSDDLLNACVQGKGNVGLCGAASDQHWDAFDGRVHISKEVGVKALLDGLMHHAVF